MSDSNKKRYTLLPVDFRFEPGSAEGAIFVDVKDPESLHEHMRAVRRSDPDAIVVMGFEVDETLLLAKELESCGPSGVELAYEPIKLPVHQQLAALCIIQNGINDGHSVGDIFNALAEVRFGGVQLLWETCASEFKAGNTERVFSYFDYAFEDDCFAAIRVGLKLGQKNFGIDTAIRLLSMKPIVTTMPL